MAGAKVLIVEDEILIARELEVTLCHLGYEVVEIASSAETALQKVASAAPELVLMDIVLQGEQDGIAAAAQIHDRFQIPVIYTTAYADEATLERAKLTHPFGYVLKPFNHRDLRVTIELALFRHRAQQSMPQPIASFDAPPHDSQAQSTLEHLSVLSHELRNPLSVIKASVMLLEQCSTQISEDMRQDYIERIYAAIDSMNRLLEDTLMLGHAESSQVQLQRTCINVTEFCQNLLDALRWSVGSQHQFSFSSQPELIHAQVDEKFFWHLLNNLLSNAIKYSPSGSLVTLDITCEANTLCLHIRDQGIGIPLKEQKRLFQPFQRGSNVGKRPGTGLGLAIVSRVVELHDGKITVESQVGRGTHFAIKLPQRPIQRWATPIHPNSHPHFSQA